MLDHSPASLLAAVHEELYRSVASADSAYARRALDEMCRHIERATTILHGLRATLDFPSAGPTGRDLDEHYMRLLGLLNRCQHFSDVGKVFQTVMSEVRSMCVAFRKWPESVVSPAA